MSSLVSRAQLRPCVACPLLTALLLALAACDDDAEPAVATALTGPALAAAGSGAAGASAVTRCGLEYAACLTRSPLGLLRCTEEAEACGLFASAQGAAGSAGAPPITTSPTCALRMAECILRDPLRAELCQRIPCEAPPR